MIIVVTGGQDYDDNDAMIRTLSKWGGHGITLFQGGARGADRLALNYYARRCYPYLTFPAQGDKYGKGAGHKGNQQMLEAALATGLEVLVLAFPGGRGTADCVRRAEFLGITVLGCPDPMYESEYPVYL